MFLPGPETAPEIGVEFREAEGEEDAGEEGEGEGEGGVGWHFTRPGGEGEVGCGSGLEESSRELGETRIYALPENEGSARQEPT